MMTLLAAIKWTSSSSPSSLVRVVLNNSCPRRCSKYNSILLHSQLTSPPSPVQYLIDISIHANQSWALLWPKKESLRLLFSASGLAMRRGFAKRLLTADAASSWAPNIYIFRCLMMIIISNIMVSGKKNPKKKIQTPQWRQSSLEKF